MKRKWIWIAPLAILGIVLFAYLGGEIVMLLWNWLLPPLFGWRTLTFWQALGLLALCRILFGGWGGSGGGKGHMRHRMRERMAERMGERMRERWEKMTPEEREKFRQGFVVAGTLCHRRILRRVPNRRPRWAGRTSDQGARSLLLENAYGQKSQMH